MTDNLVQATARAIAKEDRYYYSYGDEYYEGMATAALAVARPIIEREALEKAAKMADSVAGRLEGLANRQAVRNNRKNVAEISARIRSVEEVADAIRALGGDNEQAS